MSEKNQTSKMDSVFQTKKNRGIKKQHSLVFYDDTWQSINEHAKLYEMSNSEYLEKLQEFYLKNNK